MAQKLKGNNMKKHLFITIALVVLSNLLVAQCKLYFDGQLIKAGTEEACQSEYKHRVAEYQVDLEFEYSYQKQENEIYDKMREINPDLMQGVSRPQNNSSISRSDITDKVNAYKKRFRLSCTEEQHHSRQTNNIVQPSPRTKRVATDMSKVGLRRNTSHNQGAELAEKNRRQREAAAERARIEWEKKMAEATKDAEERAERATAPAYQMIDNFSTGGDGDWAMRERAAADRASRQIGFGVSGEEKSYKILFTDDEIKLIVKQYINAKLKDNKYGFVEHIKLCFEKKAGYSLSELLVITPGNKKRNYEIIESYNKYIDRFTGQIINEACNELYYDWGVGFCEDNLLYDMALLSDDVYSNWMTTPPGWERLESYRGKNGFYAAIYKNTIKRNIYCLAYRGSEGDPWDVAKEKLVELASLYIVNYCIDKLIPIGGSSYKNNINEKIHKLHLTPCVEDWVETNVKQGLGIYNENSQHEQAVKLIKTINNKYKGVIYITGHSLGGGLASMAGIESPEHQTYTFNAAGVLMKTVNKFVDNKSKSAKNIYAYATGGDPLTNTQKDVNLKTEIAYWTTLITESLGISMKSDSISIFERIDYDLLPTSIGNHYLIPNSNNMEHEIKPIVEYYDKSKNGSCISCQRKIIEQQRKYLEKFDSETVKKRYKIQLN